MSIIQEFANGVAALMLAKFMLNDVPHAAGLTGVQPPGRKAIPSTFGVMDREQSAHDFLLPYLRRESEDIELGVDIFEVDDYPGLTYGLYTDWYILVYIHADPVAGEVVDSLGALAHEIGHHRLRIAGVVTTEDEEAQAKSFGKHLMRKWLGE